MIPVTQTKVVVRNSAGEMIVRGNCFAAVIASIMEFQITDVPNIETLFDIDNNYLWHNVIEKFLDHHGWELSNDYRFAVFHNGNFGDKPENHWTRAEAIEFAKDKLYLVSGKSPRGVYHVCIYKNGEMVHDPHPTREGIETYEIFELLEKKTQPIL